MGNEFDVHVISHTHWDREWYLPLGRFRQRLVALVDELLAMGESAPPFLLDGQAIVLEDYLEVRPERAAELGSALRARRLEAGPWYVLADELIPSGEALVRNLLAGRRVLRSLRAEPPRVLYCPDSFGHPAALPMIARGFGFEVAIAWRGYGSGRWPAGDTARWRHADSSEILLFHLPPSGYELGSNLPAEPDAAHDRWQQIRRQLAPRSRLGLLLVQNGADHHAFQARHEEAVRALANAARPDQVLRTSLSAFAAEVRERGRAADLPAIEGELRDSYGYTWTLQGTFAARAHEKRWNALVERRLLREAEPWSALAALRGGPSRRHLAAAAWRALLRCHPHDTLCGCSIDEVAHAMESRLEEADAQARGIRDDALLDIVGHDPVAARERVDAWTPVLVVRNRAPRRRGGIATVEISIPIRHVAVGPGSGIPGAGPRETGHPTPEEIETGRPAGLDGGTIPVQVLARRIVHQRVESPRHYPRNELVERITALAWIPEVAGYGTAPLRMESHPPNIAHGVGEQATRSVGGVATTSVEHGVTVDGTTLDNGLLRIEAGAAGVRLIEHATGRRIESLISLEDVGDRGDLYTHSPVESSAPPPTLESARCVHRGPLRGTISLRWTVPAALDSNGTSAARLQMGRRPTIVTVRVSLDAAARYVRIAARGENAATDHRLRLLIATDVPGTEVIADAAFGPVRRMPLDVPDADREMETPPRTAPLHRYVTRTTRALGATIYSDGLAEYEALKDGRVAITLLRAVGALSRNDLPERPGHAGWPTPTPGAQCLGPFAGRFALLLHGGMDDATIDLVDRTADDILLPLIGRTLRSALTFPESASGFELNGKGLSFSSAKESEDGEWIVLRCTNLLDRSTDGAWHVDARLHEARLARLDETPLDTLVIENGSVLFRAEPRATVTVLVR